MYLVRGGAELYRLESATFILVATLILTQLVPAALPPVDWPERLRLAAPSTIAIALVALVTWLAIFIPLSSFPFLSDDYVFLGLYQDFSSTLTSPRFFRPAFSLLFWALSRLGRQSPVPFHLTAFVLHLASSLLVFALSRRVFQSPGAALICAVMFLLNPLQLEAVLWISGLQELLWTFFVLAALVVYTGGPRLGAGRLLATCLLLVPALAAKETAVCYVLLFPAADALLFRWKRGPLLSAAYSCFGGLLLTYLLVRSRFAGIESTYWVEPSKYFLKQFVSIPYRMFVQPWNASAVAVPPRIAFVVTAAALLLLCAAFLTRRVSLRTVAGPLVILASTLPLWAYLYVGPDLSAARYLYFAAFGFGLLVADVVPRSRGLLRPDLVAGLLIVAAATVLVLNLRPWRSAAAVVDAMRQDIERGVQPGATVARWQAQTGGRLQTRDGVPSAIDGVSIFLNGYPEFVAGYGRAQASSR